MIITPEITIAWEFVDDYVRFKFDCPVDGYCSLGWGNRDMYPCDMVGVIRRNTGAVVYDYWSPDYDAPRADITRGENEDYILESSTYSGGIISATFTRKLATADSTDWTFQKGVEFDVCWGWHSSDTTFVDEHNADGGGLLTMGDTLATSNYEPTDDGDEDEYLDHGIMLTIGWMAFAHIAIITARYFKFCYFWYWIHVILMDLAIFFTYW
jgi:hypothetical protein